MQDSISGHWAVGMKSQLIDMDNSWG